MNIFTSPTQAIQLKELGLYAGKYLLKTSLTLILTGLMYFGLISIKEFLPQDTIFTIILIFSLLLSFIWGKSQGYTSSLIILYLVFFGNDFFGLTSESIVTIEQTWLILFFQTVVTALNLWVNYEHKSIIQKARHLKQLTDNSLHPIILKDSKGKLMYASNSLKNVLGYSFRDLEGNEILNYVHPKDQNKFKQFHKDLKMFPDKRQRVEIRIKQKNNEWKWFRNEAINLLHKKNIEAIVSSFQDISKSKELDKEKQEIIKREMKARTEAENAVEMRDKFMSIASHELKTPLTTILLHLRATLKRTSTQSIADFSGEKLVKSLSVAEQQSQRLTIMIKDLLNVSLVSTGRIQIQTQPAELSQIIENLVQTFEEQITKEKIKLSVDIKDKIEGEWDIIRIEQIISNLLTNALKYGHNKPIHISLQRKTQIATIIVTDHGPGIPSQEQTKIFDLFHRVENGTDKKGLGVGLFISKQIALSHGGDLTVKSQQGKGTSFILTLPIRLESNTKISHQN